MSKPRKMSTEPVVNAEPVAPVVPVAQTPEPSPTVQPTVPEPVEPQAEPTVPGEDVDADAPDHTPDGSPAYKSIASVAKSVGTMIREEGKQRTARRWKAGGIMLVAVNAYCKATSIEPREGIIVLRSALVAATGQSSYDPVKDIRFGVLCDSLVASAESPAEMGKAVAAIPYDLLYELLPLVVAAESTTEAYAFTIVPHVSEQVSALVAELVADQVGKGCKRAMLDLKVRYRTRYMLADSDERAAFALTNKHVPALEKSGYDGAARNALLAKLFEGDEKARMALTDALVKRGGLKLPEAITVADDMAIASVHDADSRTHRLKAKAQEESFRRKPGDKRPTTARPAPDAKPGEMTEEQKRQEYERQLAVLAGNDTGVDARSRDAATLIGKSVQAAVGAFESLPGEVASDSTLMEAMLAEWFESKPLTLKAVLGQMFDVHPDLARWATIRAAKSAASVPAPIAARSESVIPNGQASE